MWKMHNPNPNGKFVGDCTVRAITKATGEDWYTVFFGICIQGALMCDMPSNNSVWGAYLKSKGFKRKLLREECPDCYTVEDFCKDHPKGTFVVAVHNHVLTVIDGDHYDSWQSGQENPIYYFEREAEK